MTEVDAIRLLHVDDDADMAALVADRLPLEDDRIAVDSVHSAEAALEALQHDDYDCVVSDHDMPGTTGIELLAAVREAHPELPFILYTGKGSEEIASEAISAGVTDYVRKGTGAEAFELLGNRITNAVERARAEAAARETRERFRTLVEEATDVTMVVEPDGTLAHVTGAAEAITGRSADALLGSDGIAHVHEADRERVAAEFAELAATPGGRCEIEFRYRRADGETIWMESRGRNLLDDPTIGGIVVYARDVTARKTRERNLERYRTMFDAMPDSAALYDAEARFVLVNAFLAEGAGKRPEEMVGEASTLIPRIREEYDGDPYQELLDGEREELRGELTSVFRDGGRPWEYRLIRVELGDGEPGAVAFSREIGDRKSRERLLEAYRQLVNALEDPVATYDADGRYQMVNRTLADRLGATPAELEGEPSRLVEMLRDQPEGDCFQALLDGERDEIHREFPSPSLGEDVIMEYHLTRLEEDGVAGGVVAISRDVTERHRREAELERTNERLEEFAGTVSHDLRNPLSVAEARLEMAREDGDGEHLAAVSRAHDRMRSLIDELLALAREASGALEPEAVALAPLVRTGWDAVGDDDATLSVETDVTVRADPGRLQQLVENLLDNAVDHGGPAVAVTVGALDDGFYVEDDGPGIPDDRREQVFEAGHSDAPGGTGFGLNIVRQVAERHGWTVRAVEGATGGARFEVTGVTILD